MKPSSKEFHEFCMKEVADNSDDLLGQLGGHSVRFYNSFKCIVNLGKGNKKLNILSLGGGSAFVEAALVKYLGYSCTILDMPGMIERLKDHYLRLGMETFGCDISKIDTLDNELENKFDVIISFENIEHLPEAPSNYFRKFTSSLIKGGYFVVSTPNLGRIGAISRLLTMKPLLAAPEITFDKVKSENVGYHRREYMPSEIVSAMNQVGLTNCKVIFSRAAQFIEDKNSFINLICSPVPRFRPHMIVLGEKG